MKTRVSLSKLNIKSKAFYMMEPEDKRKEMERTLKELEKSTTSYEARCKELKLMRGEY